MLITNVFCLQIENKKAKLYKLLQMKISFFHKFWNCARVAAFDMPPFLETHSPIDILRKWESQGT